MHVRDCLRGALAQLQALASDAGVPLASLAIAWLLSRPGVACVLFGASRPEQVNRNATLPSVPAALLAAVDEATAGVKAALLAQGGLVDQYARKSRTHGNV